MNNRQVAERWKLQARDYGMGSSMYFKGRTIYSYGSHFPMAYITNFSNIIFVNNDRYSNSTSKHQNHVNSQITNDRIIETDTNTLKDIIYQLEFNGMITPNTMLEASTQLNQRVEESRLKAKRARLQANKEYWQKQVINLNKQVLSLTELPMGQRRESEMDQIPL